MSTSPMNPGNSPAVLRDRIERLHQDLVVQRKAADRTTALVAIVGTIVIVGAGIFFFYGYRQINQLVEQPKVLVNFAAGGLEEKIPDFRKQVEQEVNGNAPQWAASLSKQLQGEVDGFRGHFVDYAVSQADSAFNEGTALSDEQMRNVIRKNRPRLMEIARQLQTQDELPDSSIQVLEKAIEEELNTDLAAQSKQIMDALLSAREKMARLKSGKNLKSGEEYERNVLMIARRIRAEHENPKCEGNAMASDQDLFQKNTPTAATTGGAARMPEKPAAKPEAKPEAKKPETKKPGMP